MMWAFARLAH